MSRLVAILILATAGAILFGQGLYIHAKAMLAQVLLQRAFAESLATAAPSSHGHGPIPGPRRASR
jgi:sortase A